MNFERMEEAVCSLRKELEDTKRQLAAVRAYRENDRLHAVESDAAAARYYAEWVEARTEMESCHKREQAFNVAQTKAGWALATRLCEGAVGALERLKQNENPDTAAINILEALLSKPNEKTPMKPAICIECRERYANGKAHAHEEDGIAKNALPNPPPEDYFCPHFTLEYWVGKGFKRQWGDAAVMNYPHLEILRRVRAGQETEFVILAPYSTRRPVILSGHGGDY